MTAVIKEVMHPANRMIGVFNSGNSGRFENAIINLLTDELCPRFCEIQNLLRT
jgi:hypothetical protein